MDKLGNLVSKNQKAELRRNVFVAGRVKSQNESVTNLIDWIHHAISVKKMIAFDYYEYDVRKQMKMRGERCSDFAKRRRVFPFPTAFILMMVHWLYPKFCVNHKRALSEICKLWVHFDASRA